MKGSKTMNQGPLLGFLKEDYRKKISSAPKDCVPFDELYDYADGRLPLEARRRIESHLAGCYHCLDAVVSINKGMMDFNNRRRYKLKTENIFLSFALISFLLSFVFGRYFIQFLAATIILSMKWIVESKTNKMLVLIYEAWKSGGERGAGRVLKELNTKKRIDI